jgi:hypothetical protein
MLIILAQALITQMWPVLVFIGKLFTLLVTALDMLELMGGGEEEVSESVVTLRRAVSRLKLVNIKLGQVSPAD